LLSAEGKKPSSVTTVANESTINQCTKIVGQSQLMFLLMPVLLDLPYMLIHGLVASPWLILSQIKLRNKFALTCGGTFRWWSVTANDSYMLWERRGVLNASIKIAQSGILK
jgi:hypothetical protein